jgi:microcystin-dependent protein
MSSSGIDAINSGPLILRTYNNTSPYKTIVLENYDIPVSSNYVLITSTNGLIAPSDTIYISSITTSTIYAMSTVTGYLYASTSQISTLNVSTLSASTGYIANFWLSSINGNGYSPSVNSLWRVETNGDMTNANSGNLYLSSPSIFISSLNGTNIKGLTNINGNVNIIGSSTLVTGALNVNGSTIISDYLSTNLILMDNGYISSNAALTLNAPNHIYISSGINDGNACIHLFNNKTIISTAATYNGCNIQLDDSAPNFNITNFNNTQTYASFTSTFNIINNKLDVTAPISISSSTHFLSIKNDYPGPINATQSSIVSQLNMITNKGQYTWWLTDTQNPVTSGGLIETNLQLYSYKYPAIAGGSKEILRIAPNGDIQIEGKVTIGTQYGGTPGNLTLSGTITTPSTISTPIIAMSTSIGGNGQITGLSSINNVQYPPPVNGEVPIGGIIMWSGTNATLPTNWAICDGGTYGIAPNQITAPDLRGRFVMGATYAAGTTRYNTPAGGTAGPTTNPSDATPQVCPSYAVADSGGQQNVTLNLTQIPAHRHSYAQAVTPWPDAAVNFETTGPALLEINTIQNLTSSEGGGQSHNNVPQYYVLAYIIRFR